MNVAVSAALEIQKPRTDDSVIRDIIAGEMAYQVFLIAHDLNLFSLFAGKSYTSAEICKALKLEHRPAEAILSVLASIGLIQVDNGFYSLSLVAEDYLLENSPTSLGSVLDALINSADQSVFNFLRRSVIKNAPLMPFSLRSSRMTRAFTQTQHGLGMAAALAWPEIFDLSGYRLLLDIGGGSGVHSIGATLRWPNLHALVLELSPVFKVTQEYINYYGLQDRIKTQVSDMWKTPFPTADLHFYSSIYHNWSPVKCRFLTQKSFESLEPGGRIIIHEVFYNDSKTGPLAAAADSVLMLMFEGQQYSGQEVAEMLAEVGFTNIEVKPTFGYWSIVTGCKP